MKKEDPNPLVSIIIPCFNVESYLTEAVDSVLCQSYTNWECLLIDDKSSDNTFCLAEQYGHDFPGKIKVLKNPGKGACDARNFGLTLAKGDYIKFLDSDDAMFDDTTLFNQVGFLQENKLDVVFGVEHYFQNEFEPGSLVKKRGAQLDDTNVNSHFFTRFPITSNFLLRSSSNAELRWNGKLKSGQEFHFLFMCLLNKLRFGFQDIPSVKIRIHNSIHRISNKTPEVYVAQTFDLIKQLSDELERYKYSNQEFLSAFNVWKLRWCFSALRVKNFQVFRSIQNLLLKPSALKIGNAEVRFLYRLNFLSPYLAFAFYQIFKKTVKRDVLRGSLQ